MGVDGSRLLINIHKTPASVGVKEKRAVTHLLVLSSSGEFIDDTNTKIDKDNGVSASDASGATLATFKVIRQHVLDSGRMTFVIMLDTLHASNISGKKTFASPVTGDLIVTIVSTSGGLSTTLVFAPIPLVLLDDLDACMEDVPGP